MTMPGTKITIFLRHVEIYKLPFSNVYFSERWQITLPTFCEVVDPLIQRIDLDQKEWWLYLSGEFRNGSPNTKTRTNWPRKVRKLILDWDSRSKGVKGYASGSLGVKGLAFTVPEGQGVGFQGPRGSKSRPSGFQGVRGQGVIFQGPRVLRGPKCRHTGSQGSWGGLSGSKGVNEWA